LELACGIGFESGEAAKTRRAKIITATVKPTYRTLDFMNSPATGLRPQASGFMKYSYVEDLASSG
jgi:hypothetical protein